MKGLAAALILAATSAFADGGGGDYRPDMQLPKQLEGIGIDDLHGATLPRDLPFIDQDGRPVKLGDYTGDKPFIVVLAYYDCPMLCSIVLNRLTDAARDVGFVLGDGFRIVTVSIDS